MVVVMVVMMVVVKLLLEQLAQLSGVVIFHWTQIYIAADPTHVMWRLTFSPTYIFYSAIYDVRQLYYSNNKIHV